MNKSKKLLSVFLAVLMIMSFTSLFASAAAPIKLTRTNIEIVAPSVSPSEINYGQTLGDLTISGGEVWYDGTQVPGYFTVYNATLAPTASESYEVYLKFVPTDANYTCTATFRSSNSTYTGTWPAIRVKAEAVATLAEAPVASTIEIGGQILATSTLSGGKVVDANGNDITALGTWGWATTLSTKVNESGTYTAKWTATNNDYNPVTVDVYVTVETVQIVTCFVDENGNAITPEIRMPINSELNLNVLAPYIESLTANCGEFSVLNISPSTIDSSVLGEYEYSARISPEDNSYSSGWLTFKLIIEPLEVTPSITAYGNDEYMISTGDYTKKPRGTYDLYVDDELVIEDIKYQERFTWRPEKSGTYNLKAVYNPVENDTYKVNDAVRENMELNLTWKINCINCGAYDYRYGETAMVNHTLGNQFAGWVFYDENGNEFTPENVVADESTSSVKFTMPDFSLTVKAKIVGEADDSVDSDDNSGSAGSTSIFSRFIEFLRNLFEKYINIFKTVFGMFAPAN